MTPTQHRQALVGFGLFSAAAVLILIFVAWLGQKSVREELSRTRLALESTPFSCPDGTTPEIQRSGEIGWSRFCQRNGVRHGQWQAWEKQRIIAEGAYSDGMKNGLWVWYQSNGEVHRVIEFVEDKEMQDQIQPSEH